MENSDASVRRVRSPRCGAGNARGGIEGAIDQAKHRGHGRAFDGHLPQAAVSQGAGSGQQRFKENMYRPGHGSVPIDPRGIGFGQQHD